MNNSIGFIVRTEERTQEFGALICQHFMTGIIKVEPVKDVRPSIVGDTENYLDTDTIVYARDEFKEELNDCLGVISFHKFNIIATDICLEIL